VQLFYDHTINEKTKHHSFDKDESRHIVKVLRKQEGDLLHITNGNGYIFEGRIVSNNIKQCSITIEYFTFQEPLPYQLHLLIAPTKNIDRLEWFLEKSTEIGITEITPMLCSNSERKTLKLDRCERILESAMKQSLSAYFPKLNDLTPFSDAISKITSEQKFIAHCEDGKKVLLKQALKPSTPISILIGPEGDFSPMEIKEALDFEFTPVSLGDSRLRTETAGIVACHSVNFINQ